MKVRGSETRVPNIREIWDLSQVQSKRHFFPKRRGPEQIKFPLKAKKAIILLTGRPTLAKAKIAFLHYAVARYMAKRWNKQDAARKAKKELDENLKGDWELDFFKFHAEEYGEWPRRNFDAGANRKRLSKIFSRFDSK
jgi:hypothetical protein